MPKPRPIEGFLSKGRIVYSVLYSLESSPPRIMQLVVPLNREGKSLNGLARPANPDKRIVQVLPGEEICFRGKTYKVTAVEAYRWASIGHVVSS